MMDGQIKYILKILLAAATSIICWFLLKNSGVDLLALYLPLLALYILGVVFSVFGFFKSFSIYLSTKNTNFLFFGIIFGAILAGILFYSL